MASRKRRRAATPQTIADRVPQTKEAGETKAAAATNDMSRNLQRRKIAARAKNPAAPPWYAMAAMAGPSWKEAAFSSGMVGSIPRDNWGNYFERVLRYDVFWAHYEGTVYRQIHLWAKALKYDYKLYEHIRSIFSPAYRIVEFWGRHLMGGPLDPEAGDGSVRPSAIPIVTDNPNLRKAIARLWRASNWQSRKNLYPRYGAAMGDVGLMVVDDPIRQTVSIRVVSARTVIEVARDPSGNAKGYTLSELRLDPTAPDPLLRTYVTYSETARQINGGVEYTTYWNGTPFDWRDYPEDTPESEWIGPTWVEDYREVPFVLVQNRDMGLGWGWSELQPDLAKLYEQDDIASKVSDSIRKVIDPKWYATNCAPGQMIMGDGEQGREDEYVVYGPKDSKMEALVSHLDLPNAIEWVKSISAEIESDHPELATEDVSPDASGEARRAAREMVEGMVVAQRAPYDDGMVLVHKMAIDIAVRKGYPGYDGLGFDEDSYDNGDLDHGIGDRPVFTPGESDRIACATAKSVVYSNLTRGTSPVPMAVAMELAGWPKEVVDRAVALALAEQTAKDARDVAKQAALSEKTEDGTDAGAGSNADSGDYEGPEDVETPA